MKTPHIEENSLLLERDVTTTRSQRLRKLKTLAQLDPRNLPETEVTPRFEPTQESWPNWNGWIRDAKFIRKLNFEKTYLKKYDGLYGPTYAVLDILQKVFYSNNGAREAFVELCDSKYVQQVTFDSYLYKKVQGN